MFVVSGKQEEFRESIEFSVQFFVTCFSRKDFFRERFFLKFTIVLFQVKEQRFSSLKGTPFGNFLELLEREFSQKLSLKIIKILRVSFSLKLSAGFCDILHLFFSSYVTSSASSTPWLPSADAPCLFCTDSTTPTSLSVNFSTTQPSVSLCHEPSWDHVFYPPIRYTLSLIPPIQKQLLCLKKFLRRRKTRRERLKSPPYLRLKKRKTFFWKRI